ncbi:hypothetical protein Plec18167_002933 [Paecilomyces lecythidis]|uniref:DUF6546 domain-containing protein n=1 Tax=Paecilomyces lecythidis TaxID=3004212 RepID=A0ABR3Y3T2_9EURO
MDAIDENADNDPEYEGQSDITNENIPKTTSMSPWASFPAEIRLMILESLTEEIDGLACAPVCKDWQTFIENRILSRLKLRTSDLDYLEHITARQRRLVKHIWLNIELRRYTCRHCQRRESSLWRADNSSLINDAIMKLFSILSNWGSTDDGLTLELSMQSPSDSEHWFKNCYFGAHGEDENVSSRPKDHRAATIRLHDPKHGWVNGRQVKAPNRRAIHRLHEPVGLKGDLYAFIPRVSVVTGFVVRRQCRRRLFSNGTIDHLLHKLPQLKHIVFEPWRTWDIASYLWLKYSLSKKVRKISIFEDFNDGYLKAFEGSKDFDVIPVRIATAEVSTAFAKRSLSLEKLASSFVVEACHFFEARQPKWTWRLLQSLVLTSRVLTRDQTPRTITNLLEDSGAAALNMPRLDTMALWNYQKGEACVFTYHKGSIIWRGTWDMELEPRVIEAWRRFTTRHTSYEFSVKTELLPCDIANSHGDAIYHLKLPREVIDPVSLWQIRRETAMARGNI